MPPGIDPVVVLYYRWYMRAHASGSAPNLSYGENPDLPSISRPNDVTRILREDVRANRLNECEALTVAATDSAYYLGSLTGNVRGYFPLAFASIVNSADRSVVRFNNFASSPEGSLLGLSRIPGFPNAIPLGGDGYGFRDDLRDSTTNTDQSHHFAAFFLMGYSAGNALGQVAAIARDIWPLNSGDINLGMRAAQIGAGFRSGALSMTQVAGEIYKLCK